MQQRTFKFKAWNNEEKLLVRLNSIECVKGVLSKKNHILLQFTGALDKNESEIYESDILLKGTDKYIIRWDHENLKWIIVPEKSTELIQPLADIVNEDYVRLCNKYEAPDSFNN